MTKQGCQIVQDDNWQPAMDLHLGRTEFVVVVDLPGLKVSDVKISRSGDRIMICGSRRAPYDSSAVDIQRGERRYGSFNISVQLPERYLRKWQACSLLKGVLRITFPVDDGFE
mmetsp:Transcript_36127/g.95126  ORF Transcript_36127/g.95126 Transcript_36127/m.95126 type:complete len:113 (-) Transcript_36127:418-756(-)